LQVRGWAVVAWAHHLAEVYRNIPEYRHMQLGNDAVLAAYSSLNGVPDSLVQHAAAPTTDEESQALHDTLLGEREGYAATRTGSTEDPATYTEPQASCSQFPVNAAVHVTLSPGVVKPAVIVASVNDNSMYTIRVLGSAAVQNVLASQLLPHRAHMEGLDEVDLQINPAAALDSVAALQNTGALLKGTGVLASVAGTTKPYDDYSIYWPVLAHPDAYPWGTGYCPPGMNNETYVQLLLNRNLREQFAQNCAWQGSMFNIMQRHNVNAQSKVTLRMSPHLLTAAGNCSEADVQSVLKVSVISNLDLLPQCITRKEGFSLTSTALQTTLTVYSTSLECCLSQVLHA
jgi:hypothetical protein